MSQGAFYVLDGLQPAKKSNSSQIAMKLKKKKKKSQKRTCQFQWSWLPSKPCPSMRKHELLPASFSHCYFLSNMRSWHAITFRGAHILLPPNDIYSVAFANAQAKEEVLRNILQLPSHCHTHSSLTISFLHISPPSIQVFKGLRRRLMHLGIPHFCPTKIYGRYDKWQHTWHWREKDRGTLPINKADHGNYYSTGSNIQLNIL